MDWLERINRAFDYIENNLDNEIDYAQIAKAALCSEYHLRTDSGKHLLIWHGNSRDSIEYMGSFS